MLHSQGIDLAQLNIPNATGQVEGGRKDPRAVWRLFAENFHLFRATPVRWEYKWLAYVHLSSHSLGLIDRSLRLYPSSTFSERALGPRGPGFEL